MQDASDPVRRLCVALDVARDTASVAPEYEDQRRHLVGLIERASAAAGLDRLLQQQGDGLLLLLPAGVNEPRVIADLTRALRTALRRRDLPAGRGGPDRLRVRLAFHQGITRLLETGFVGRAVTTVHRLRDSDQLRDALRANPQADLGVIISEQLFEDTAEQNPNGLPSGRSWHVRVEVRGASVPAWIHVPDLVGDLDDPDERGAADAGGAGDLADADGGVLGGVGDEV